MSVRIDLLPLLFAVSLWVHGPVPVGAAEKVRTAAGSEIRFRTERAGTVLINIHRADGTLVRRLVQGQRYGAGAQSIAWDGRADDGSVAEPGEYTWRGLVHEGIGLKLRGWAANGGVTPWETPDGKGGWGGDAGVPSAAAADDERVYLGWSLAEQGRPLLACDLEGRVRWGHRRPEGASGCKALAVDEGVVYVLGGLAGVDAEGGAIYKLGAKDGKPLPWPNGATDFKISSLWPDDGTSKPAKADGMAVRHGHIYLTFTSSEFMAVLDAKTGAYLQTVVGAPPGLIDVVATQTDLPDAPGKLVDADFAVISLGGGVLGKVLFAHDPLWVVTSELTPMEREVDITALTVLGDGAKFHRHEAIVGLGAPFHQVQARPLLNTEVFTWFAGRPGGRPLVGLWQTDALRAIRGLALAADGKLWVAEADAFPKRVSVWDSGGQQGKLVREFFGPAEAGAPGGAINPLDPDLMFAQGCEWRIDRESGQGRCLGVVTREAVVQARFGIGENGNAYLVAEQADGALSIFERVADGDYKLRARLYAADGEGRVATDSAAVQTVAWADENGDGEVQAAELQRHGEVWRFRGLATLQDLALTAIGRDGKAGLLKVQGWTACGAPRFELAKALVLPGAGQVSADGRRVLSREGSGEADRWVCRDIPTSRSIWSGPIADSHSTAGGVARLASPLGNVWLLSSATRPWRLVNEDGFELAQFFESEKGKVRWPKSAAPGADMTHAPTVPSGGLTQAADGKLYLQAGDAAYWNLEVTGLEKARALSGGTIVVPGKK